MPNHKQLLPRDVYTDGIGVRSKYLDAMQQTAELTIPYLFRDTNDITQSGDDNLPLEVLPVQSVGAEGLSGLAIKLMNTLFPPNMPFFMLDPSMGTTKQLANQEGAEDSALVEAKQSINMFERLLMTKFEALNLRPKLPELLSQYLLGNVALERRKKEWIIHKCNSYVVNRTPSGKVYSMCLAEKVSKYDPNLPEEAIASLDKEDKTLDLYTLYRLKGTGWDVTQQIGEMVLETKHILAKDFPFIILRGTEFSKEDYGYGYFYRYIGNLRSNEAFSQAISDYGTIASRLVFLVNDMSMDIDALNRAENGEFVFGDASKINPLNVTNIPSFQVVSEVLGMFHKQAERVFLMARAVQRNAERVTAEEIRHLAQDIDTMLGGIFTLLSEALQKPLFEMLLREVKMSLDHLKGIDITILTGLEAMKRREQLNNYNIFSEAVLRMDRQGRVDTGVLLKRYANALGINPIGLFKQGGVTNGEVNQENNNQQEGSAVQEGNSNTTQRQA